MSMAEARRCRTGRCEVGGDTGGASSTAAAAGSGGRARLLERVIVPR